MEIVDYLEDISKLTKEEIEGRSISCPLDENGHVQLTPEYWNDGFAPGFAREELNCLD